MIGKYSTGERLKEEILKEIYRMIDLCYRKVPLYELKKMIILYEELEKRPVTDIPLIKNPKYLDLSHKSIEKGLKRIQTYRHTMGLAKDYLDMMDLDYG